jgi:hypothetical protein
LSYKIKTVHTFKNHILIVTGILFWICLHQSCTHDSIIDMEPDPVDTMDNPIDTMDMDTTIIENPCDPDVLYFEKDILPIFVSNCAISGCHNAATATNGVVLDNFENIISTGEIEPFDLNDSEVYEVITEDDPDKVMPPTGKLSNAQINLIATWILQGAQDLECDEEVEPCNTENVSYSGFVVPLIQTYCNGCHTSSVASGGIITDNYTSVKAIADNGRLYGALNWETGFEKMPQGLSKLDRCDLDKIKSWIDAGAENN